MRKAIGGLQPYNCPDCEDGAVLISITLLELAKARVFGLSKVATCNRGHTNNYIFPR